MRKVGSQFESKGGKIGSAVSHDLKGRRKREHSSSYKDAYMSLSLPLIFSPYVRLELLRWDPLHNGVDFQEMKWY